MPAFASRPLQAARATASLAMVIGLVLAAAAGAQTISTVAGTIAQGSGGDGGDPRLASLAFPSGVYGDTSGVLYIADTGNHRIRRVSANHDTITAYAGTGTAGLAGDGGAATAAQLTSPTGVFATAGGVVYVADTGNHVVRRIAATGIIGTVAGTGTAGFAGDSSAATSAQLNSPRGVYVTDGGVIYIADTGNHRIRRVSASGTITTYAGTGTVGYAGDGGTARAAQLNGPEGVFADTAGNVYVTDTGNHRIRVIAASDSTISTLAGDGTPGFAGDGDLPTNAHFAFPRATIADSAGNLYVADRFNQRVRRVHAGGNITTLVGDGTLAYDGDGAAANLARLASPSGLYLDRSGILFIADRDNHRVRQIRADHVAGLAGADSVGPGREVRILRAGFTGDGVASIKSLSLTIADLTAATGLSRDDFQGFNLYESADTVLSADDQLVGALGSEGVTIGSPFTIQITGTIRPAYGEVRHYLVGARLARDAVEGHAFRVGMAAGGLATSVGGRGQRVSATDVNRLYVDVVATRLLFTTHPAGPISGNPLLTQPVVTAFDDSGFVDADFTDAVTLTDSAGTGTLLHNTATATGGVATFTNLTYVAGEDQETFYLIADDAAGGAEGDLPRVTSNALVANSVNNPPAVDLLSFIIDEDDSVVVPVAAMVSDVDDSLASLELTFISSHLIVTVANGQITIQGEPDFFGLDTLALLATDSFGAQGSDRAVIEVRPVNDLPVLNLPDSLVFDEDTVLDLDLTQYVDDLEDDFSDLKWSFTPSPGLIVSYTRSTGLLRLQTAAEQSGTYSLGVRVYDKNLGTVARTATVVVADVNAPPFLAVPDTSFVQGTSLSLQLSAFAGDADHGTGALTFSAQSGAHVTAAMTAGSRVDLTADAAYAGVDTIVLSAVDPLGAAATDTVLVAVIRLVLPPSLSAIPIVEVELGDTAVVDLRPFAFGGADSPDSLLWQVEAPSRGQATIAAGLLTFVPAGPAPYAQVLTVSITDSEGQSASGSVTLVVSQEVGLIAGLPDTVTIGAAGTELFLDAYLVPGLEEGSVAWSALTEGDLLAVIDAATRVASLAPEAGSKLGGLVVFQALAADGETDADSMVVNIANPAPTVAAPDLFLDAGESAVLILDDYAQDDESMDRLTWSATPLAPGVQVSVNQQVRSLTLTAASDAAPGTVAVALEATDAQQASGRDTLAVTLRAVGDTSGGAPGDTSAVDTSHNQAPIVGPFPDLALRTGGSTSLSLDAYVQDDGPDALVLWSWQSSNDQVTVVIDDNRTALVAAADGFTGSATLSFTAVDSEGASASASAQVTVLPVLPELPEPDPGDFDRSSVVGLDDFFLLADHLGLTVMSPRWDPIYDLDDDGRVSFDDFFIFAGLYEAARAPGP